MNGVQIGPVGIGGHLFKKPGQLAHVHEWHLQATREAWHRTSLETTYRELSDKDIEFLLAMLPDSGPSRISEIAKRMGVASNYASQYKRRLLEDGVIGERGRGLVGFDIPRSGILNEKAFSTPELSREHQRMAISNPLGKE
ncbi:MAG: hypothetical protein ACLS89_04185 [Collinsella sp.]